MCVTNQVSGLILEVYKKKKKKKAHKKMLIMIRLVVYFHSITNYIVITKPVYLAVFRLPFEYLNSFLHIEKTQEG